MLELGKNERSPFNDFKNDWKGTNFSEEKTIY